jgi:hypothetical protein
VACSHHVYTSSAILNSLIPFPYKTALLWRFNDPGNIRTYLGLHVKRPIFLPDLNQVWIFSTNFCKISKIKFRPVAAALIHADGGADMTMLSTFRDYSNAPKNVTYVGPSRDICVTHVCLQGRKIQLVRDN